MDIKINGFDGPEIIGLYAFLKFYEDNNLKKLKEKDAIDNVPCLNKVKELIKGFSYKTKTKNEINSIDISSLDNEIYFTEHVSDLMGILYHLRNSIAHAKIEKDGETVKITDYDNNKSNPLCTTKGTINFKTLKDIISVVQETQ